MAITKRLRFEVLRRDKFRCYYCGTRGNETTGAGLTIDHVTPVALGGTDDPANLVSACRDCNSGKSATPADAETVADVDLKVASYNTARALALKALEANLQAEAQYVEVVWQSWNAIAPAYAHDRAPDLQSIAGGWFRLGVPLNVAHNAIITAWEGPAGYAQKMRYAGGVVRNVMAEAEDRTRALAAGEDVVFNAGYEAGWNDGEMFATTQWERPERVEAPEFTGLGVNLKGLDDGA